MKINQVNVANHGIHPFKKNLINRYNFKEYYSTVLPCFFFGAIGEIEKINNHKGLKIVQFITPSDCLTANELINSPNLFIIDDPNIDKGLSLNKKNIKLEFKDYSLFKPKVLEDKIYSYMRDKQEFKYDILQRIQKKINFEIIFGGLSDYPSTPAELYPPIEFLKENYYDKCFLNINLSSKHGYVTVREFGLMGIKTLMSSPYDFPSIINIKNLNNNPNVVTPDEEEIIELINMESKKIGQIQDSINPHNVKDEWLDYDFWI
jgi:hypothetical protein